MCLLALDTNLACAKKRAQKWEEKWNRCTHLKLRISSIWTETRFGLFPAECIISGVLPEYWEDRLLKIKGAGLQYRRDGHTVEPARAEKGRV